MEKVYCKDCKYCVIPEHQKQKLFTSKQYAPFYYYAKCKNEIATKYYYDNFYGRHEYMKDDCCNLNMGNNCKYFQIKDN